MNGKAREALRGRPHYLGGPLLLVTSANPSLSEHTTEGEIHPNLGRLVTPRHYPALGTTVERAIPWAADNDCFQGLNADRYFTMLDRLADHRDSCLFVTVPDVVGDAVATARKFESWAIGVERRGLPVALVAQDGIENVWSWLERTWHRLDAVFVGGSTEWKEGPVAAEIARLAHRHGKWVHWGRVNTRRRFDLIRATGAVDSFDGTKWARFRKTYLDQGLEWCRVAGMDDWWSQGVAGGRQARELNFRPSLATVAS